MSVLTKKTTELVPGDVVICADIRDKILSVKKGTGGYRFRVERTFTDGREEQPAECWLCAGVLAEHEVENNG